MSRRGWIFLAAAILFLALLILGLHRGDAQYVLKNAENFCFT